MIFKPSYVNNPMSRGDPRYPWAQQPEQEEAEEGIDQRANPVLMSSPAGLGASTQHHSQHQPAMATAAIGQQLGGAVPVSTTPMAHHLANVTNPSASAGLYVPPQGAVRHCPQQTKQPLGDPYMMNLNQHASFTQLAMPASIPDGTGMTQFINTTGAAQQPVNHNHQPPSSEGRRFAGEVGAKKEQWQEQQPSDHPAQDPPLSVSKLLQQHYYNLLLQQQMVQNHGLRQIQAIATTTSGAPPMSTVAPATNPNKKEAPPAKAAKSPKKAVAVSAATAKPGRKKKASSDRPKRPLSAYNLFFKDERAKLLSESSGSGTDGKSGSDPEEEGRSSISSKSSSNNKMVRIGFEEMAQKISTKWREIDQEAKARYQAIADKEKDRYSIEKEQYLKKQQEDLEQSRERLEATVDEETRQQYLASGGYLSRSKAKKRS